MKKLFIALTLFILSLSVGYPVSAASTVPVAKPAMQWHCLATTYCGDKNAQCATGAGVVPGHRVKLNTKAGDLPTRNAQTTPFVCVATKEGNICTSGDDDWDLLTVGYRGLSKLQQTTGFKFQGLNKGGTVIPISPRDIYANESGKLSVIQKKASAGFQLIKDVMAVATQGNKYLLVEPIEWQDYTPAALKRKWVALNLIEPAQIAMGQGGEQQGTFTFEGAIARCASITWDPFGLVFDSRSLEPVAGVTVTLKKKDVNGKYVIPGGEEILSLPNPVKTIEDGKFEFYVPNATYRLEASAPNFIFPNAISLNRNYSKIYSDIYRGEDIIEANKTEHRDIPIDSKGTPYHSAVKLLGYSPMLDKGTNSYVVEGTVSHPLTKINIYGKKPSGSGFVKTQLLTSGAAGKDGQFRVEVDLNKLEATEMVGELEFVKPDYANLNDEPLTSPTKKNAVLAVEPIPNYLEGYAYDRNGKPMPNAAVGIYLNGSNKSSYEATTDQNGFYRITSEYLPEMAYGIRYTNAGGAAVPVSTSQFIAQNAKYLVAQQANLFAFKNKNGQVFTATSRDKFGGTTGANGTQGVTGEPNSLVQSNSQAALLPIILILVILGIGSLGVIMYFMKKK